MPNPVAANDSTPISGSLQTSRISYGVDLIGKNYGQNYNGTKWYSDIPNDGTYYTIVSDNYTANYYISRSLAGSAYVEGGQPAVDDFSAPVFWTTQGTSSADIIAVVNGLPDRKGQTAFTTGEQALNWIASSGNYFAIGPDYFKQIEGDQLQLFYNANQIISYPTTSSIWYDISGHDNEGLIENGTSFDIEGWFDFDGVDDLISTNWNKNGDLTYEGVFYLHPSDSGYSGFFGNMYSPTGYNANGSGWIVRLDPSGHLQIYIRNNNVAGSKTIQIDNFRGIYGGQWIHLSFVIESGGANRLYVNNDVTNGSSYVMGEISSSAELLIGAYDWGGRVETYYLRGSNQYTKSYSKALTEVEILQNYYGGPIVTDGLVYALDAGNLVSYPRNGVDIFDLTTQIPGVLTNGTTFSKEYGGSFELDGVDDFISTEFTDTFQEEITVEIWYRGTKTARNHVWDIGTYTADANLSFDFNDGYDLWVYWNGGGGNRVRYNIPGGFTNGEINHLVYTHIADVNKVYLNGEELTITEQGGAQEFTQPVGGTMQLGRIGTGLNFEGSIYSYRVYNRYLTQQEIQQNYNATK